MNRLTTNFFICIGLSFVTQPLLAQKGGKHMRGKQIMKELELSKEQREEIKDLRKGFKEKIKALRESTKEAQDKLHALMKSNAGDSEIMAQHNAVHELKGKQAAMRLEMMLQIRSKLSEDQRKKFAESLPEKPPRGRHGRHGKHGKRGPPDEEDDDLMGIGDE